MNIPADKDVFVVELGGGNDAAAGVATPTFINFPISTAAIAPLEQQMRERAGEGMLGENDMRQLRAEIHSTAATLAPTVIPPGKSAQFAEVLKLANVALRYSDLKDEKQEFKDLALRAPLEVKVVCQRLNAYSSSKQSSELPSHLMEALYLTSEQCVRQQLPLGHTVLRRVSEQVAKHLKTGIDNNWFASHSLPTPPETDRRVHGRAAEPQRASPPEHLTCLTGPRAAAPSMNGHCCIYPIPADHSLTVRRHTGELCPHILGHIG